MEIGYKEVALAVTALYMLASIIVRITPTEKDDIALAKISGKVPRLLRVAEILLLGSRKKKDK